MDFFSACDIISTSTPCFVGNVYFVFDFWSRAIILGGIVGIIFGLIIFFIDNK